MKKINNASKQRVLIIQEKIPPYRVPVFDALARCEELQVTVACSEPRNSVQSGINSTNTAFAELIVQQSTWGPFKYQSINNKTLANYDIVIAMFDVRWLSTLRLILAKRTTKLILWGHGFGKNQYINKLRLSLASKADALLFYDNSARVTFNKHGLLFNNMFVAPNTIWVPGLTVNWNDVRTNFLFVGRLQARKQIDEILIAFQKVLDKIPRQCNLVIVGDGDERSRLEDLARDLQLNERITFLGNIRSDERLAEIFKSAIAYISPGHVGLGVLHSFAHGVPVVTRLEANHAPEVNNIIDRENGCFYDGSIESLSKLLVQLANDRQWATQLGRHAYNYYWENRTVDHMVDGFKQAIQHVIKNVG